MVKRLVDVNATYEIALGRKRAFGDETKGTSGLKISKKNENRLAAVMLEGESLDDALYGYWITMKSSLKRMSAFFCLDKR